MIRIRKLPILLFSVFLMSWSIVGCGDSDNKKLDIVETTVFDNEMVPDTSDIPLTDNKVEVATFDSFDSEKDYLSVSDNPDTVITDGKLDGKEEVSECIPSTEICDGKDNDCDEKTDEEFPEMNTVCIDDKSECLRRGVTTCGYGNLYCDFFDYIGSVDSLTVRTISCNSAKLNWAYYPKEDWINALGFVIQRKAVNEEKYKDIAEVSLDANEYLDTDVIPNTTYFYMVRVKGEKNDSDCSNEVFTTTADVTMEEVVKFDQIEWWLSELTVTADTQSHLHLAFCDPVGNKLYYGTNIDGDWNLISLEKWCGGLSIATDSNNKAHIFNFEGCGGDPDLYYHTNATGEWQTELITWWAWCSVAPNVVIDNTDNVHFVYEKDGGYGGGLGLNYTLITQNETQFAHISDVGIAPTIALDNQFILHLLFWDSKAEPPVLKYGTKITNEQWDFQVTPENITFMARMAFDNLNAPHILFANKDENNINHLWVENNNWKSEFVWSNPWLFFGFNWYNSQCRSIAIDKETDTIHGLCGNIYFYKKNGKWFPVVFGSFNDYNLVLDQNGQAHILVVEENNGSGAIKHLTIQECK